jgi:hypothetical protein
VWDVRGMVWDRGGSCVGEGIKNVRQGNGKKGKREVRGRKGYK